MLIQRTSLVFQTESIHARTRVPWKNAASGGQKDNNMVTRSRFSFALFLFVLLAGQPVVADDDGWRVSLPASTSTPLQFQTATPLDDGGFLSFSATSHGRFWVVRHGPDEVPVSRQAVATFPASGSVTLSSMGLLSFWWSDGIMFPVPEDPAHACSLRRGALDELDLRRFRSAQVGRPAFDHRSAGDDDAEFVTTAPRFFAVQDPNPIAVVSFARDCHKTALSVEPWRVPVSTRPDGGVYVLDVAVNPPARPGPSYLKLVDSTGERWRTELPRRNGDTFENEGFIATAGNGDALVHRSIGGAEARIQFDRIDSSGELRWSVEQAGKSGEAVLLHHADIAYWAVPGALSTSPWSVQAIDAAGELKWTDTLEAAPERVLPTARAAATPLWKLFRREGTGSSPVFVYALVSPGESGIETVLFAGTQNDPLAELADGSLLVRRTESQGAVPRLQRFVRGVGGTDIALPEVPEAPRVVGLLSTDDSLFLVTIDGWPTPSLHHLSATGILRWSVALPPHETALTYLVEPVDYRIAADESRVCLWRTAQQANTEFACRRRDDGAAIYGWKAPELNIRPGAAPVLKIKSDGGLVALGAGCTRDLISGSCLQRAVRFELDPAGNLQSSDTLADRLSAQPFFRLVGSSDGSKAAIEFQKPGNAAKFVMVHDAVDGKRWEAELGEAIPVLVGDDGSLSVATETELIDFSPQGERRWSRPLVFADGRPTVLGSALENGDRVMFYASLTGVNSARQRLRAEDGSMVWEHFGGRVPHPSLEKRKLQVSGSADLALLVPIDGTALRRIEGFDLATGTRPTSFDPPAAPISDFRRESDLRVHFSADGELAIAALAPTLDSVVVESVPASRLAGPESDSLSPAVLGVWSNANTSGQGLLFDHDPALGLVYGGWFTFDSRGGHDSGRQRWYTLVGSPTEDGSPTTLTIYRNEAGWFAEGTTAAAVEVGSAVLRVLDCTSAVLNYRFTSDIESGVDSVIPLRRIAPPTRGCEDSVPTAEPSHGLDSRSSGVWQVPGVGGQGLLLDLRPPREDDTGFLSGGWFTYAPEGEARDPLAQHWFTLAGDLSQAAEGSLQVPLYRSVGGSLDGEATSNTWQVGEVTLTFSACDRARLDYAFLDDPIAHAFAGLQGSLQIERIGACAP
jgi:hypothetical protein